MTQDEINKIQAAQKEDSELVALVVKTVKDYKAGGAKAALANVNDLVKEGKEAFEATKAVIPVIKEGKTTTEFVLSGVVIIGVIVLHAIGKPLPMQTEMLLGGVSAVYTLARSLIKSKAATT